jgi:hypothetical protein
MAATIRLPTTILALPALLILCRLLQLLTRLALCQLLFMSAKLLLLLPAARHAHQAAAAAAGC